MTENTIEQELIYFNGLREDGEYFTPPLTPVELAQMAPRPDRVQADEITGAEHFGLSPVVQKPNDLSKTGWGVIFAADADDKHVDAILDHLQSLLKLRESQAKSGGENYFQIFRGGGLGFEHGDTRRTFLKRLGVGPSDEVDPSAGVPYYLLLVGSPEEIPYHFQFELDVQFAVGRIDFGRDYAAYAHYARNVVMAETGQLKRGRTVSFFGVAHDDATRLSANYLIRPLVDQLSGYFGPGSDTVWSINQFLGPQATRSQLEQLLGGPATPALLFTASHGMVFSNNHPKQIAHQGALVCQDWRSGPVQEQHYFAGDHLSSQADLCGQIVFCFACFGAGTPDENEFLQIDRYKHEKFPDKYPDPSFQIVSKPFVAGLPTRLLGRPNGALAFIGHVERAWDFSFGGHSREISTLEGTLFSLLMGNRLGQATDPMNRKYATVATEVTGEMQTMEKIQARNPADLPTYLDRKKVDIVRLWTEHNDARNYIVIGDPAASLVATAEALEPATEPYTSMISVLAPQETVVTEVIEPLDPIRNGEPGVTAQEFGPLDLFKSKPALSEPATDTQAGEDTTDLLRDIQKSIKALADKLAAAIQDVTSLEIKTYTSDDLKRDSIYDHKSRSMGESATLQAYTHISYDGNVTNLVPQRSDSEGRLQVDRELWAIHREMIQLAATNRTEFIRAVGEISGTMIRSLR